MIKFLVISHHPKGVYIGTWHSITCHVPFSPNCNNLVIIWHMITGTSFLNLNGEHSDLINNVSWNQQRSHILHSFQIQESERNWFWETRWCWKRENGRKSLANENHFLVNGNMFTTGFNPMSKQHIVFWNSKKIQELFALPEMDTNNGCCCYSTIPTQYYLYHEGTRCNC